MTKRHPRTGRRWGRGVVGIALAAFTLSAAAEDRATGTKEIDELRRQAEQVEVSRMADGRTEPLELVSEPLLRYTDPAREAAKGALWAFGKSGRPAAVLEMEVSTSTVKPLPWVHGVVSLSPGLIAASWNDGKAWQASQPGLIALPIPNAPAPTASKSERLRQMKDLARRFSLHEDAGPVRGKIELRLIPTPIYRYDEPSSGLQDGAIFAFATGTNPESLLVLESRAEGPRPAAWHYGLARVSGAALTADLDGRPIWSQDEANPPHNGKAYMNRRHAALDNSR